MYVAVLVISTKETRVIKDSEIKGFDALKWNSKSKYTIAKTGERVQIFFTEGISDRRYMILDEYDNEWKI